MEKITLLLIFLCNTALACEPTANVNITVVDAPNITVVDAPNITVVDAPEDILTIVNQNWTSVTYGGVITVILPADTSNGNR